MAPRAFLLISLCACALLSSAGPRAAAGVGREVAREKEVPGEPGTQRGVPGEHSTREGASTGPGRARRGLAAGSTGPKTTRRGLAGSSGPGRARRVLAAASTGPRTTRGGLGSGGPARARRGLTVDSVKCITGSSAPPPAGPVAGGVQAEDAAALLQAAAQWAQDPDTVDRENLLGTWDTQRPCTEWYGVTCDSGTGQVRKIKLPGLGYSDDLLGKTGEPSFSLSGPLPAEFGSLTDLRYLKLARNNLTTQKEFPQEWASLRKLSHLDLSLNFVDPSGNGTAVPPEVCNLTSLTYLNLNSGVPGGAPFSSSTALVVPGTFFLDATGAVNGSSGSAPIPQQLTALSRLAWLDLSGSALSDADLQTLGSLTSLKSLFLRSTGLTDPWSGANSNSSSALGLSNLEKLDLSNNPLSEFPPFLQGLPSLVNLKLRYVYPVVADLPSWLGSLNLTSLDLSHSRFPELSNLTSLSRLEKLSLASALPDSSFPEWLESITSLKNLNLRLNGLNGSIPDWVGRREGLTALDLSSNGFSGSLSGAMFREDRKLTVASNEFSGALPPTALSLMAQRLAAAAEGSSLPGRVNVSNNFLIGPCYSPQVASLSCPEDSGTNNNCAHRVSRELQSLAGNCLQGCDQVPVGTPPPQRSSAECAEFFSRIAPTIAPATAYAPGPSTEASSPTAPLFDLELGPKASLPTLTTPAPGLSIEAPAPSAPLFDLALGPKASLPTLTPAAPGLSIEAPAPTPSPPAFALGPKASLPTPSVLALGNSTQAPAPTPSPPALALGPKAPVPMLMSPAPALSTEAPAPKPFPQALAVGPRASPPTPAPTPAIVSSVGPAPVATVPNSTITASPPVGSASVAPLAPAPALELLPLPVRLAPAPAPTPDESDPTAENEATTARSTTLPGAAGAKWQASAAVYVLAAFAALLAL